MSLQSRQSEVARLQRELASLRKQDADAAKQESSVARSVDQAVRTLGSTKNTGTARTYSQKLVRLSEDTSKIRLKRAEIARKVADITSSLHRAEQALAKEQETERRRLEDADKRRRREELAHQRALSQELSRQRQYAAGLVKSTAIQAADVKNLHDAFISHASEDKEEFVRPLATALQAAGFDIWYDEYSLRVGDSLRQSIDKGLSGSRFGIVVLSSAFFSKNWPQYELNGLVAKEMQGGKVILPIWHKVSKDEVMKHSPTLADKVAINSSLSGMAEIVEQLASVLRDES